MFVSAPFHLDESCQTCRIFFSIFKEPSHRVGDPHTFGCRFCPLFCVFYLSHFSVSFPPSFLSFLKWIQLYHLHTTHSFIFPFDKLESFLMFLLGSGQIDTTRIKKGEEWGRHPTFHLRTSLAVPSPLPTLRHSSCRLLPGLSSCCVVSGPNLFFHFIPHMVSS